MVGSCHHHQGSCHIYNKIEVSGDRVNSLVHTSCKQTSAGWGLEGEAGEVDAVGVEQIRKRSRVRLLQKGVSQQEEPL